MILDNRQPIPDIVISRQAVPNIQYNDNPQYNELFHDRLNGARREIQSGIPQKVKDPPKHLFASGNNNGSPRHVPKNGNIYVEDEVTYNFGGNKVQQCDVRQNPMGHRPPILRRHKEEKSNIPRPSRYTVNSKYDKHHDSKPLDGKAKRSVLRSSNSSRKGDQMGKSKLFVVHENKVDNGQESYLNRNSTMKRSTELQSQQHAIPISRRDQISATKLIASLTDSLETISINNDAVNFKQDYIGCQKINEISENCVPDNSYLNVKYSNKFLTNDKIGNLSNSHYENKSQSSDDDWLVCSDSLSINYATPACQNLDLNWQSVEWNRVNQNNSFYMDTDKSEEENDKVFATNHSGELLSAKNNYFGGNHSKLSSMEDIRDISLDSEEIKLLTEDDCSSSASSSYECKMAVVKCNGNNYLTKLIVNDTDIHGVKIVGRIGIGGKGSGRAMSLENPVISGQMQYADVRKDVQSENASSLSSQGTDSEFEHEAADYQWLLDYEYRENYSRDSLATGKDGSVRISILQNAGENAGNFSYEAISRNLDANLAEIDMDDFRSEDIHQILSLPSGDNEYEEDEEERYEEECQNSHDMSHTRVPFRPQYQEKSSVKVKPTEIQINDGKENSYNYLDCVEDEEYCCGASGEMSLYKSGPLFSPFREPIPPSFSVDSLDSGSIHEDLILTCQANKDNYTIAFEGSFVHNSSNSDYRDTGTSESGESATWSTENLDDHIPASDMTHSDQPYTTWSRVSRRLSQTPECDSNNSVVKHENTPVMTDSHARRARKQSQEQYLRQSKQHSNDCKSCSMPNLMRRSLMRKSLETSGQCMKVYDLQKSLRSNNLSQSKVDANNFSLLRLFMKQKSLGKEAITRSSSFTDPSNDGCYSSSEHHSTNNESSDWPMNSQSETDLERSSSPVQNFSRNVKINNQYNIDTEIETFPSDTISHDNIKRTERIESLNNNNNSGAHHIDNVTLHLNNIENLNSFDDSLRDVITCSKPPMTSPIREEPEGMEMSLNQESSPVANCDSTLDRHVLEKSNGGAVFSDSNATKDKIAFVKNSKEGIISDYVEQRPNEVYNVPCRKETPKHSIPHCKIEAGRRVMVSDKTISNKKLEERKRTGNVRERPKPRPRITKESTDQYLNTTNLKPSTALNTSKILDQKEVYVYYPNYALPDLHFLKDKKYSVDTKIFLVPQHYNMIEAHRTAKGARPERPLSYTDITKIKKENFSHVEDWESLTFLLPKELKEILRDSSDCVETMKPSFCHPIKPSRRPVSCDFSAHRTFHDSKGSSTSVNSTHPSSGYRGSSTMLNDSDSEDLTIGANSLAKDRMTKRMRPTSFDVSSYNTDIQPLPKGVLRKCTSIKGSKRNSCDNDNKVRMREELLKRRSLPEFDERNEDNGGSKNRATSNIKLKESKSMQCSCLNYCTGFCSVGLRSKNIIDPVKLPRTHNSSVTNATEIKNLKTRVSNQLSSKNKFTSQKTGGMQRPELTTKMNMAGKRNEAYNCSKVRDNMSAKLIHQGDEDLPPMLYDLGEKKTLVLSVRAAVEKLVSYFQLATPREKMQTAIALNSSDVAHLVLNKLCPAVYALLSDGLLPSLHSLFGKITNSVWKVVEATSQLGPSTKALHDLVMTLNGEECLAEGPIKFNAFIFGLLNLRSLDAWLSYLRTREVALQKHYHPESFLYLANTAMRSLFDDLLLALRPLALLPFHLDILFEYKTLHASLLKMEERLLMASRRESSHEAKDSSVFDHPVVAKESKEFRNVATQQDRIRAFMQAMSPQQVEIRRDRSNSPRPRSCYEKENNQNVEETLRKRWSGVQLGSKLVTALDKLLNEGDEDYTDFIDDTRLRSDHNCVNEMKSNSSSKYENVSEHSATAKDTENEKSLNPQMQAKHSTKGESEGDRFRRLQFKWEQMALHPLRHNNSQGDCTSRNSCGPDKSTSPGCTSRSRIPRPVSMTSPQRPSKPFEPVPVRKEKPKPIPRRSLKDKISTTDLPGRNVAKSRLKCKKVPSTSDASGASSVPGRGIDHVAPLSRYVQTLHHRLATDNGHLSFNKGDLLSVVVDVDEKYILCCLNDRRGIVPRSSVILFNP